MKTPTEQGYIALRAGDPASAMTLFREALDAEPNDVEAWKGTVQASRYLRIWAEVARALERVVALTRDRRELVDAHLARARVLDDELGDGKQARKHYEGALMVDPDQSWPYLALAELDLRTRNWSRAVAHADHGLEFCAPDSPERPFLLLIKATAIQQVSVSMGPVSTFFRGLRGEPGDFDPAEEAVRQAGELRQDIADRPIETWLEDTDATSRWVRERMPKASLPSWWF